MDKINIDINYLISIAMFLEGYKAGKGNLLPLGTDSLEHLWYAVKYLQGDVKYKCEKLKKG